MTTEFERMRQGEVYDFMDPEIHASLTHARKACAAFRKLDTLHSAEYRAALLDLIPGCPESSMVSPGVTIGKRCIIAAGSVVTRDIPDDSLAAGNPAVVKKTIPRE